MPPRKLYFTYELMLKKRNIVSAAIWNNEDQIGCLNLIDNKILKNKINSPDKKRRLFS